MIKYYNSLSSFSKTYLNNSKEKEVGKEPTQTNFTRRKSRFFSLIAFFLFMTGTFSFAQTVTIGTGTATNTYFPIYSCYGYNYSQQIYTAAQIGQAGTINKIRFYYDNGGTPLTTWESWRVLVGHTPKTDFVSNTDWIPVAGLTEVFNGVITPVAGNWFDLNFTTPFVYDGTSNFVVAVDENTPSYSCTAAFRSFTSGSNTGIYYYSDSNNPDPASPPSASSRNGNLAQLQVVFASTVAPGCAISFVPANAATGVVRNPVLTWMEGPGGAQSYDVYFGTTPTPPLIGNQPGTSYTPVAPLNTNTTYYWKVVPINPIGIATGCTVNSFTTGTGFNYCLPVTTYGCSNGATIGSVSTSSAITNISNLNSGCTSLTGPSYNDYSATMQMAASQGTQFNISVGITNYSAGVKVWIDYNQNGTFEATEIATQSAATIASGSTYSGVINIPATALLGTTRMRVRAVESYTTFGPCDIQNYGETEDYAINIITPPSCMPPTGLALSALTTTQATMSWTASTTNPTNGYDVYYSTSNVAPTAATVPTVNNHPASPYMATSLTPATTYYWWVRSDCGTETSLWSTGGSFYTSYCLPTGSTNYYLTNVSTSGGTTNFTNLTGSSPGGYGDYSATISASNFIGQTTSVSLTSTTTSDIFSCWIDWNNDLDFTDAGETVFVSSYSNTYTGSFTIPPGTPLGNYRMRVSNSYIGTVSACGPSTYGEYEDYTFTVVAQPSCMPPSAITSSNITATTATLAWTEMGTATDWEIQYGIGAFVPNTGPSLAVTTNPYSFTNLQPSSTYRFYVRARCSATDSSFWSGPHILITNCAPITALPWTENFDNLTTVGNNSYPPCWVDENPGVWGTTNAMASTLTSGPLSGPNYLRIRYGSNATMWTPEFDLVAGETYEFSFNWGGDSYSDWDGGIYVNTSQAFAGATLLGAKFVEVGDPTTLAYRPEIYCFTPTTSGVYSFGIKVIETGYNWYMSFDDFKLKQVVTVPGIDGSFTACQTGAAVDLNTIITASNLDGSWNFGLNPNAVDTAGLFNAASVPAGVHDFFFITAGCAPDTTIATVTIIEPSSAGSDGSLAVCRNQPFNLLQGLNGMVDFGGIWTNPNAQVVPNGNATSSNIPGQYNFQYIVTNGVCPADTANVVVNVQGCDYLGLEDVAFEAFNMYPNPSSDMVFITNTGSTEVFNYEVLDMNGRVILKANNAINGSTTTELDLRQVEIGVYLIRVFNDNADKTFRVVKN